MFKLPLAIVGDLERVQRPGMHVLDSHHGAVVLASMIVGELIARIGAPGHGGGVQRPEGDDHDGNDEDDGCHDSTPYC